MDCQKLRNSHKIIVKGEPYVVVGYKNIAMSRGGGKNAIKMKNLLTGGVIEETYNSGTNIEEADISMQQAQFLYANGDMYTFMESEHFEQFAFEKEKLGDVVHYLTEGLEVSVMFWDGNPINVELPPTVRLRVIETEPGVRGDTASGGTKPAKLETDLVVQVPFFVNEEDSVVVNTVTGEYKERVKN